MWNVIMAGIVVAIVTSLLTYTIHSLASRNSMDNAANKAVKIHERINHKDSMYTYVSTKIKDHKADCNAPVQLRKIEKIVIAIYISQGGKIEDLDI